MAIDFRFKDFCHPLGIYRLRRQLEKTQWLPPEELQAYQDKRLTRIVQHSAAQVPYYRDLFKRLGLAPGAIRTAADLQQLPLLSKERLRENQDRFLAANAERYNPVAYSTSGTTGTPLTFWLDKHANILEFVYYWRHWSWAGYRLGDRFAELGSVFFLKRKGFAKKAAVPQRHMRRLMLNSNHLSAQSAGEMAAAIRAFRPRYLKGMASALYFLAWSFHEAGITDIGFKGIFSTGETLTPQYREVISKALNGPVLDSYGHMERTAGISQCLEGGYHVNADYGLLELVDARTAADGRTRLARAVGTSLYNLAMPLLRYEIGDDIELFDSPRQCACGRTLPLVKAIHGRREDTIVTPDGRFITALFVLPEFVAGAKFIQFIQETAETLTVHVVPGRDWNQRNQARLADYIEKLVGDAIRFKVHTVFDEDIVTDKSGKIRCVISRVARPDFLGNGAQHERRQRL